MSKDSNFSTKKCKKRKYFGNYCKQLLANWQRKAKNMNNKTIICSKMKKNIDK
jgi:hypothetical protein